MRQIARMSNRLMPQFNAPFNAPTLGHLTSYGTFGRHTQQDFEPSGVNAPNFAFFLGDLEALHSKGLNDSQTSHGLRRVTPFGGLTAAAVLPPPVRQDFQQSNRL